MNNKNSGDIVPEETIKRIKGIYEQIHVCVRCTIGEDPDRVLRLVDERAITSKIFLIGQALGGNTQRRSGRPYTRTDNRLSRTGKRLDKFLRLLGYTIDYQDSTSLFQYVYSSDIVQCYPTKKESGYGDRKPYEKEILNCISQGFLLKEIQLVEPRLIVIMGKQSRDCFYRHILQQPYYPNSLSQHIDDIVRKGQIPCFNISGEDYLVSPMQHPSGANPLFSRMFGNDRFIELIKKAL
jgi:uracil-DNA glycosylase family 4